jgi:hypothetical protein
MLVTESAFAGKDAGGMRPKCAFSSRAVLSGICGGRSAVLERFSLGIERLSGHLR